MSIPVAILGASGRGAHLAAHAVANGLLSVHAVLEVNAELAEAARIATGAVEAYTDLDQLLQNSDIEAVIIGTPMHVHAQQAIAALDAGKHVLCEVVPCISWEEARALTAAARRSRGIFMLAENYCWWRSNLLVSHLAAQGLFGTIYAGEGEYLHQIRKFNPIGGWRRRWQTGVDGNTYGTHALGPLLRCMGDDRVTAISCVGGGRRHRDDVGALFEQQSFNITLARTVSGAVLELRLDMLSDRPHSYAYRLQGTDGCYESARHDGESDRIWLRSLHGDEAQWHKLSDLESTHADPTWQRWGHLCNEFPHLNGHGGSDLLELATFADVIMGTVRNPLPIDVAMDLTLPGLASQDSIQNEGAWITVPDSRTWAMPAAVGESLR